MSHQTQTISRTSGFNPTTKTYHSLRTTTQTRTRTSSQTSLSVTSYIFSLLHVSPHFSPSHPLLINSSTNSSLSYSSFLLHVTNLSTSLPPIPARHVALILSPPNFHVPVLYFSLLSLNVVVSPANPLSTSSELTHLVSLSKPAVIFTVSSLLPKLPANEIPVILIDSPEFDSMVTRPSRLTRRDRVKISQDDSAVILYSSGTTGRVKGVELTHRNLIALISGYYHRFQEEDEEVRKIRAISLVPLPLFHVFGFGMLLRAVTLSETLVMMERFDFEKMLAAVERYKVLYMPVSPPLIVALAKSELVDKYDVSSLRSLGCGGAPLGKDVAERFKARFPDIEIVQVRLRTSEPLCLSWSYLERNLYVTFIV